MLVQSANVFHALGSGPLAGRSLAARHSVSHALREVELPWHDITTVCAAGSPRHHTTILDVENVTRVHET